MLELYHNINSVCAQKIRIALVEKGLQAKEHLMTLRGDQFDPAYMKLNSNAVVPTLVHDGHVITESSIIRDREAQFSRSPIRKRAEYKRDVVEHGLDSKYVQEALDDHKKLLRWIDDTIAVGPYLAGEMFSNADVAAIPYVLRLELLQLSRLWDSHPGVGAWWERVRIRPSVEQTILQRMTESDWTPFKSIAPDPWPKVRELLAA